jgi:hypothetical protein
MCTCPRHIGSLLRHTSLLCSPPVTPESKLTVRTLRKRPFRIKTKKLDAGGRIKSLIREAKRVVSMCMHVRACVDFCEVISCYYNDKCI